MAFFQSVSFEIVGKRAYQNFYLKWFQSLLRQDFAYFDVYGSNEIVSSLQIHSDLYRRGIGKKFGELFYATVMSLGSFGYALYASWKVALVALVVLVFMALVTSIFTKTKQRKSVEAASAYQNAAVIANSAVSSIRTLLSLNAIPRQIELYSGAASQAYHTATSRLWKLGFFSGKCVRSAKWQSLLVR